MYVLHTMVMKRIYSIHFLLNVKGNLLHRSFNKVRWAEYNKRQGKSEIARHILENTGYTFSLCNASLSNKERKILKPKINDL